MAACAASTASVFTLYGDWALCRYAMLAGCEKRQPSRMAAMPYTLENVRLTNRLGERSIWPSAVRSEEHTSELQSLRHLVCRLLLEKKKSKNISQHPLC